MRLAKYLSTVALLVAIAAWPTAVRGGFGTCDADGLQASGAVYRICNPPPDQWNGDLVVYAHGYVSAEEEVGIPEDHLMIGGISIPQIVNLLGFAFATTSYSTNGLAIREGLSDIVDVVNIFTVQYGEPSHVYLVGPSEGGLITALAVEQYPEVFDGGLSTCGPIGDFRAQLNYVGDFRVLFDYFFPNVLPGIAVSIPQQVIDNWDHVYEPRILAAVRANRFQTQQLLRVSRAPIDVFDATNLQASIENTVVGLLWYNVFGTNDAIAKLGGQPFDNLMRRYTGSSNDLLLNTLVARFTASAGALNEIQQHYQTSGEPGAPILTMHTLADEIVPYGHEILYRIKTIASGSDAMHANIPIVRYGHCQFTVEEVLIAFAILVQEVSGRSVERIDEALNLAGADVDWPGGTVVARP